MKTLNNIVLVSVIMLLFVENYTQAQSTSFICGTDKAAFEALIESADVTNCSKNSQAYMNKYQLQTHYIPNSSSYEAVKTIPINIVVFLEDDATIFPFQVSGSNASYYDKNGNQTAGFSTTTSDVQHHEDWMNRAYDQTQPPNGIGWQVPSNNQVNTMPQNVSYLSDSKIRFVIKHYYFYENSVLYNGNSYANDDNKLVYHLNKNPETINHLNCILAKNIGHPTAGGYADIYEHNGKKAISVQSLCLNYTLFCDDFYTQNHLSHEFGHHLRFWHTYDYTETHDTTNIDYLDDVFPYPPFRFIGDNVLGGSEPNDFISPKQMGRAHRTLALDLSRHFAYGYSTTPHEITSDELWDFAFKSYNDIVIKNGATLTINCRLEMVPEAKIIVEKGGKLIIDGATITSARCGGPEYEGLWKGIYLEGDYSEIQIPANKGYVELKNGAVIENAEVGITTMPLTFSGVGKILGTGGIIQAEDATFRNCQYGIRMYPYQNYNYSGKKIRDLSFMKNSIFETTDDLIEPAIKPVCFIDLTEVYNVDIVGNTFRNINPNCTNANDRGNGIFSMDAKITINHICSSPTAPPPCTTFNTNKFEGLKYGIYAMATQANIPLSIKNSEFENNCYGVYLSGISSATVTSNKFNVILDNTMLKTAYGLYLDNCTGYTVEENEFDKVTGTGTYQNVGMVINNSGSDKNQIYNNTFENITHGMLAQHDNRGNTDKTGLKIKCNDFTSVSNTDLGITKKGSYSGVFGIANHQGADAGVSSPAGNTFSWAGVNIYSDINNAGENISKYYHHEIQLATPSAGENWVPVYFDATKVSLDEAELLYYTKAEACPSNIIGGGLSISQLYDEVSIQSINVSSSELILDIWKDGGLEDLPEQIELAYPWETYVMYNTLISGSPYLSDETMIEAINNTALLPDLLLKLVLIANPQCTRSDAVMQALEDRNPPLPQSMIDEIMLGEDLPSPLEALEATVSYYTHKKQYAINLIKMEYLNDTINNYAQDSLLAVLGREYFLNAKYEKASIYLKNENFNDFDNTLDEIQAMIDDNEYNIEQYNEYSAYFSIVKDMLENNKSYSDLSTEQQDVLLGLADNGNFFPAAYARALLFKENVEYEYEEPVELPVINSPRKRNPALSTENSKAYKFEVYPNPAYDYVIIDYKLKTEDKNAFVQISDNSGRLIKTITLSELAGQQVVDCKGMTSGLYNFVLKTNIKVIETKRISINN